jgi:GAF domain-containing protein
VVAVLTQAYEQRRRERERQATEVVAVDMRVAMNDALDPIVRQLGRIAVADGRHEREELREQTIPMVLYSAALLIGPDRVRACWFRLDGGASPRALRPVLHEGRAGPPRTTFLEGTPRGNIVFELLAANTHLFCEDVRTSPPPGWDPAHPHEYQTFLAVPVVAGSEAYGMLTVDSLLSGDLSEGDVPLLRLLAGLLADALAYGS